MLKNVALFKHFHEMELKEAFFWLLSEWSIRKTMQQEEIIISQGQEGAQAQAAKPADAQVCRRQAAAKARVDAGAYSTEPDPTRTAAASGSGRSAID